MKESLDEYKASIALAKQLAEGETLYFGELNADEQNVLSEYYFVRRDAISEGQLEGYRQRLATEDPSIEGRALAALGRLRQTAHG